jgi:hypothetical protein
MFLFLGLAFAKRFTELRLGSAGTGSSIEGRGYYKSDFELISSMGMGSGYLSVLVLAMYITHPSIAELYLRPRTLLLICPVFLYWTSRVWLLAHRGQMYDDPIVFALKDWQSWIILGIIVLIFLAAVPK